MPMKKICGQPISGGLRLHFYINENESGLTHITKSVSIREFCTALSGDEFLSRLNSTRWVKETKVNLKVKN